VAPVVIFPIVFLGQLIMLALASLVLMSNGIEVSLLTTHLPFPFLWAGLARGLVVLSLWWAPVVGWLLLVSAWARRVPILWAIGPWAAVCIVEHLALSSDHVLHMIAGRLAGGFVAAFTVGGLGKAPIEHLADLNPLPLLANPHLWIGLVLFALSLAACVWLRRRRESF
jgi:ABC-2 type transport system permease protein